MSEGAPQNTRHNIPYYYIASGAYEVKRVIASLIPYASKPVFGHVQFFVDNHSHAIGGLVWYFPGSLYSSMVHSYRQCQTERLQHTSRLAFKPISHLD